MNQIQFLAPPASQQTIYYADKHVHPVFFSVNSREGEKFSIDLHNDSNKLVRLNVPNMSDETKTLTWL